MSASERIRSRRSAMSVSRAVRTRSSSAMTNTSVKKRSTAGRNRAMTESDSRLDLRAALVQRREQRLLGRFGQRGAIQRRAPGQFPGDVLDALEQRGERLEIRRGPQRLERFGDP